MGMPEESPVVTIVVAAVVLLLVASVSAVGLKRARLPYSVGLVLIGLGLGYLADTVEAFVFLRAFPFTPDLILFVFLPTLIFESAFSLDARLLAQNLVPVLALAAPGLLMSTAMIGAALVLLTPLSWGPALLFGALISATDPVAVVSLFKEVGAPKRLAMLVEGESLFNDATAIVLFKIILSVVGGGVLAAATFGAGFVDFIVVFLGGLAVGGFVGYLMVRSITLAHDAPLVEVSLSTVVAYAAFVSAEHLLGVSGVMATVGAGVMVGAYGTPRFTPPARAFLRQFWEYAAFVANGLIFLLVGLAVNLAGLGEYVFPILVAIAAALVARAVVVFVLLPLVCRLPRAEAVDRRFRVVLWWGGLRGAVALALAFSLPETFANRDLIVALTVGVVLFTLLSGGLTMGRLIHMLGLDAPSLVERMARWQATLAAKRSALVRIGAMETAGHFSPRLLEGLRREYEEETERADQQLRNIKTQCHENEVKEALWFEALTVAQTTYRELQDAGAVSEPVLRELDLVVELQRDELKRGRFPTHLPAAVPIEVRFGGAFYRLVDRVLPNNRWGRRHRIRVIAARYERDAAILEASRRVTSEIGRLAEPLGSQTAAAEVESAFRRRGDDAMKRLDETAQHFPEYVRAVQTRTARRVVLDAEVDAVGQLAMTGGIPEAVAAPVRSALMRQQRLLVRQPVNELAPRPEELLTRVPLFSVLTPDDFSQVVERLVPRPVLVGETIIKQGERGSSLFLVARGVVAVFRSKDGYPETRVASLHAGDFFGETALLTSQPRNATVRAVTDCQLYELSRSDVDSLCEICGGVRAALEAEVERREGNRGSVPGTR